MAGSGRTDADEILAAHLAAGARHMDAAKAADVSERTLRRRLADPEFVAEVARLRAEMVGRAAGRLADSMAEASDVLKTLLADADANIRHRSATKVIELGMKVAELTELQKRVEQLETLLSGKGRP